MKATKEIVGTFVFRNEGDGCLTSKYFHGNQKYPFVEACKKKSGKADQFSGTYKTVWIQDNYEHIPGELQIHRKPNNTYKLSWKDDNGDDVFEGIGMIFDNLLVGSYWN